MLWLLVKESRCVSAVPQVPCFDTLLVAASAPERQHTFGPISLPPETYTPLELVRKYEARVWPDRVKRQKSRCPTTGVDDRLRIAQRSNSSDRRSAKLM